MISRCSAAFIALALASWPLLAQEQSSSSSAKATATKSAATSTPAEAPPIIQLQITIVAVPKSDSLTLVEQLKNPAAAEGAYRAIAADVKTKRVKLIAVPTMETRSGNRAVSESINEVRYAIQYQRFEGQLAEPTRPADTARSLSAQPPVAIGVVPTAFETRNTGFTFEAEPILHSDGKTVDVQLAAQHCQLLGWDASTVEQGGKVAMQTPQPRFHTNKVSTNMSVTIGQYALAGVFESGTDPEVVELFILQASIRTGAAK